MRELSTQSFRTRPLHEEMRAGTPPSRAGEDISIGGAFGVTRD